MKLPRYESYQQPDAEWLGELPAHWEIRRTKTMFSLQKSKVGNSSGDYTLLSLTLGGVIVRNLEDGGKLPAEFDSYQIVEPNDLVFCLFDIDETPRTIGISYTYGMITGAYSVYRSLNQCVPKFAYYYFLHLDSFKGLRPFYTGLRKVVRADTFSKVEMPAPPLPEQTQIAAFLDYETAKIDGLIEKQQRLIELLREKRQAVISHAVTKGLNPDAPMRDSGVEWLGEVSEGWEVKQIRHLSTQLGGGTPSKDNESFWGGDVPWITPKDMKVDYINTAHEFITETAVRHSSAKYIPVGSVLIVVRGMILDHSVPTALTTKRLTVNQDMKAIVPCDGLSGEFLLFVLKGIRDYLLSHTYASAHGTKVMSIGSLGRTFIALPGYEVQIDLVEQLKSQLGRIDGLIVKSRSAMTLLQERRSALISAAVTGKIDVRDWRPPSAEVEVENEATMSVA